MSLSPDESFASSSLALPGWRTEAARRLAVLVLVTAAWTTTVFLGFYPGLMSADPLWQLDQGIRGEYWSVHAPLLSILLGVIFRATGSVWPALLIQLLTLSGFMAVLAYRTERWRSALAVLVCFLAAPPVWSTAAAVWKDNAMTSTLLLAVIALLYRKPGWALVLLVLSSWMRLNAVLAAAPLVVPLSGQLVSRWGGRPVLRIAVLTGCLLAVVGAPKLLDRLVSVRNWWSLAWVLTDDLASIYARRPDLYAGSMFESEVSAQEMGQLYSVNSSLSLFTGQPRHLDLWPLSDRRSELKAEWLRIVLKAPGTYLRARTARFLRLLGMDRDPVHYPFHTQIDPNPYGLTLREHTLLHRGLRWVQESVKNSLLFRGAFWVGLLLVIGAMALRKRRSLSLWVVASGLAYTAGYFPLAPAADFRYLYWPVVCVFAALLLLWQRDPGEHPDAAEAARGGRIENQRDGGGLVGTAA